MLIFCGLLASSAQAGKVDRASVAEREGLYAVDLVLTVAAPTDAVRAALADYEHLELVSPAVRDSRVLGWVRDGRFRVYTLTQLCVWVLCKDLVQVQDMGLALDGDLSARIVPGMGDFWSGWARWRLSGGEDETRIAFTAELRPAFWVPPAIGSWWLERMLRDEARRSIGALESLLGADSPHGA